MGAAPSIFVTEVISQLEDRYPSIGNLNLMDVNKDNEKFMKFVEDLLVATLSGRWFSSGEKIHDMDPDAWH